MTSSKYIQTFTRLHLDYADIIYDKPDNVGFESKLEKKRYNACLVITSAIQGTNGDSIYAGLGLESFSIRRRFGNYFSCTIQSTEP